MSKGTSEKLSNYCNVHISAANASQRIKVSSPDTSASLVQRFRSKCEHIVTSHSFSEVPKMTRHIFILFFFLLPFHAFLVTWLNFGLGLNENPMIGFAVSAWREIIIAILTIFAGIHLLKNRPTILFGSALRSTKPVIRLTQLDFLVMIFFLFGLIFLFYKRDSFEQWMQGARYDFEFFYFYWLVRSFGFSKKDIGAFLKSVIAGALIVLIFGLILQFLPQDFLTHFGYSVYQNEWKGDSGVFSCHLLEFNNNFCRMQSTFGGPGRYASYLLFVIALSGVSFIATKQKKARMVFALLFIASLVSIIFTLSRANWIGLSAIFIAVLYPFLKEPLKSALKNRAKKIILIGAVILSTIIIGTSLVLKNSDSLSAILFRSASTFDHFQSSWKGMVIANEYPFGIGLGKVGPASFKFEKFLTENAFLQIIVEMGFFAGAIFMLILLCFLQKLCHILRSAGSKTGNLPQHVLSLSSQKQIIAYSCFLTLIGLLASGLFIHSFEETSLTLTLFGLIGALDDI